MYVVKLFVSIVYSVSERFTIAGRISQYCYDIISIQCTSDIRDTLGQGHLSLYPTVPYNIRILSGALFRGSI